MVLFATRSSRGADVPDEEGDNLDLAHFLEIFHELVSDRTDISIILEGPDLVEV
jgi:hypothetical protein